MAIKVATDVFSEPFSMVLIEFSETPDSSARFSWVISFARLILLRLAPNSFSCLAYRIFMDCFFATPQKSPKKSSRLLLYLVLKLLNLVNYLANFMNNFPGSMKALDKLSKEKLIKLEEELTTAINSIEMFTELHSNGMSENQKNLWKRCRDNYKKTRAQVKKRLKLAEGR
jgi:hypothetical protein